MLQTTAVTHSLLQLSIALIYGYIFWVHADIRLLIHGRSGFGRQVWAFLGVCLTCAGQRLSLHRFGIGEFDLAYVDILWILMRVWICMGICGRGFRQVFGFAAAHYLMAQLAHLVTYLVLGAMYGGTVWQYTPLGINYMHEYLGYGMAALVLYMAVMGDELHLRRRRGIETRWEYVLLLLLPSLLFLIGEALAFGYFVGVPNNPACVVVALGLFAANVVVRILYLGLERRSARLELYGWYADQQARYMARLKEDQRELWRYIHDERKHNTLIYDLLSRGEHDRVMRYLSSLNSRLLDVNRLSMTGNIDVDTVLSAKYEEALSRGITLWVEGALPEQLPIDLVDLCMLLGNCLDNAMAAVPKGNKRVDIGFYIYRDMLLIRVVNPCDPAHRRTGDNGLGLEIIERVAARYDGSLEIIQETGHFTTEVLLHFSENKVQA